MKAQYFSALVLIVVGTILGTAHAEDSGSLYLKAPESWRAEVLEFPLSFAPEIKLEGREELRFAPGMFDAESETYFTYGFIWLLNGQQHFKSSDFEQYLLQYFQGLYLSVSKKENKSSDGFKVNARLSQENQHVGQVEWRDPFVTEDQLTLNFKTRQWLCPKTNQTMVVFSLSPKPYGHANWIALSGIKSINCL